MNNFFNGFEKAAKITIDDLEDQIGEYLRPDAQGVPEVMRQLSTANERFPIKHPILAGIPTLGIWPTLAKGKAMDVIKHDYFRKNPKALDRFWKREAEAKEEEERRQAIEHQRAVDLMPKSIEDRKRESHERMLETTADAALRGLGMHYGRED